jgi:hypothetical protein
MRKDMNEVNYLNISTGLRAWWHILSKHPRLTAKQKLLVMEMLRRNEAGCDGTAKARTGWFWYPEENNASWCGFMHQLIRGEDEWSVDHIPEGLAVLEETVKGLRCSK